MQPSAPPHLESTETIFSSSITKLVVFICWLAILADGYDLGIYGAVLPKLLEDKSWHFHQHMLVQLQAMLCLECLLALF